MEKIYSLSDFGVSKHEETLKNGLKVVFIKKPFSPIRIHMMMRAGAIFDPSHIPGLAHFTEHILASGSKTISQKNFWKIPASVGAYANACTGRTYMSVELEIALPEHLKHAREYFSHALLDVNTKEKVLDKEKEIINSEIQKSCSKDGYLSSLKFLDAVAVGTNWGKPILGTLDSVRSISALDVENFFQKHCCVENMVLIVAGGCEMEDIRKAFSDIDFLYGDMAMLPGNPPVLAPNSVVVHQQNTPETRVVFGFVGPTMGSQEDYLLTFATQISHGGMTSLFKQRIREEKGLAYSVDKTSFSMNDFYYFGTEVGVPFDRTDEVISAIKECYEEFIIKGVKQKEINDRINSMWFSSLRTCQESSDWVNIFDTEALYPTPHACGEFPDIHNYRKTFTAEAINEVIRKFMTLDKKYLFMAGRDVEKYR